MGPKRKKSKLNAHPADEPGVNNDTQISKQVNKPAIESPRPTVDYAESTNAPNGTPSKPSPSQDRQSWYGGSWGLSSKSSPVAAEVARESISVTGGAMSEASAHSPKPKPGAYPTKSMRGSRKSIPVLAEATRVYATSDASRKTQGKLLENKEKHKRLEKAGEDKAIVDGVPLPPEPVVLITEGTNDAPRPTSGAWFGWCSRPDGYGSYEERIKEVTKKRQDDAEEASRTPLPGTPVVEEDLEVPKPGKVPPAGIGDGPRPDSEAAQQQGDALQPEKSVNNTASRGWFGLWSSAQNEQTAGTRDTTKSLEQPVDQQQTPEITVSAEPEVTRGAQTDKKEDKIGDMKSSDDTRPQSSGWAFWSTDKAKDLAPTPGGTQKQIGELAVADTPSQSHPEAAQFNEQPDRPKSKDKNKLIEPATTASLNKRGQKKPGQDSTDVSSQATPVHTRLPASPADSAAPSPDRSQLPAPIQRSKQAQTRPNLILPTLSESYSQAPNTSYLERLTDYLAESLHVKSPPAPPQHVNLSLTPPNIKRAIAIGVHGYFPVPLIQKVLGQPTGTSIRFANSAAAGIKSWAQDHQPNIEVEIETVSLEGEGYIDDRITTLWKLLLNWLSHLRQADFILIASHSQGVPVAITLVSKLIQLGCLSPHTRIGVCAMAGVSLGPFAEYRSRLFGGSAGELFEFSDPHSRVSKNYAVALEICLRHGVRITYTGSLDDQLVSLESSLNVPVSHPYINRNVFIDGRIHAPNFLTHLVVFALKLRNLGVSDHGLVRELSGPLAGSLVGGEGHSRVYDDAAVYKIAIEFALQSSDMLPPSLSASTAPSPETRNAKEATRARRTSVTSGIPNSTSAANAIRRGSPSASLTQPGTPPLIAAYEPPALGSNANPFYLPWAVRGMLEETVVKHDLVLHREVQMLVKEFEDWRPASKVLKDVRWRLEGVRSLV